MSAMLSLVRITKFTFQNFFRNFWLSFISISIFVLTLLTINAVLFINVIADAALQSVEQKVEVAIYFNEDTSQDLVTSAQGYLLALPQVRDVAFISSEDSLEQFKQKHAGDETILASLEEVDGNPFGHALIVSAHSADDFPFILEAIETPEYGPFIKEKDATDYEVIIERIKSLSTKVKTGGILLAAFFSLVAILIIFNTIRVAIYVHRDEISIMKLVGANDWFVRGPFVLESLLYSLFGTIFVAGVILIAIGITDPWMARYFGDIDVSVQSYFFANAFWIFGIQFILISLLSLLTTLYAMRRYLRV
ncbi:permease-like cell division protein FtsX [Patescibacteria group bacterium]|nr:permease-like cell division protein FtsX [Patescibacteria group bacterium]